MNDIMPWLPDRGAHTYPLDHMTCRQAREAFAVAPILMSGWTCTANSLSPEAQAQLMINTPLHLLPSINVAVPGPGNAPNRTAPVPINGTLMLYMPSEHPTDAYTWQRAVNMNPH